MTWLILTACLVLSFLISGAEAGILSLNRVRVRHQARRKDRAAIQLQRLLEQPARLLVTVLITTNFLNIVALVLLANTMVRWSGWVGYFLTLVIALPLFVVVVEMLPKSIFRRVPYRILASFAAILDGFATFLWPFIFLGSVFAKHVLRLKQPREIFVAREDLKYVTTEIERMGMLTSIERQMIHNVVDFRTVKVADVMVKYSDVVVVRAETTIEELVQLSSKSRFDRYPIVDDSGKIIGIVNVFDLIVDRSSAATASNFSRRILTVRSDEEATVVLRRLRASPLGLAAVVDPSGETVGIVSAEDLLNPLVRVTQ
jgi:putative hemolysin